MTSTPSPYAPPPGPPGPDAPGRPGTPGGPQAPARPPLDPWSVVALVAAVLGVVLVGLAAAVVGLVRTAGGRRRGRGLAVAGLVVSLLVGAAQVALLVVLVPFVLSGVRTVVDEAEGAGLPAGPGAPQQTQGTTQDPDGDPTGGPTEGSQPTQEPGGDGELVDFDELEAGDCFVDPSGDTFVQIEVLPCDVPHDGEVIAELELADGPYPGDDEVYETSVDACLERAVTLFEAAGADGSQLDFSAFTPTDASWVLFGDREATCVVYAFEGRLEAPVLP